MTNGQSGGTNSTTGGHTDHPTKLHPQKVMECDNFLSFHAQYNTKEQTHYLMNQQLVSNPLDQLEPHAPPNVSQ